MSATLTTIFFPIFPWIFQILVIVFAVMVGLYLASVGTQVHTIVGLAEDPNCVCSGAAAAYKVLLKFFFIFKNNFTIPLQNGDVCDPTVFSNNCHRTSSVLSQFFRQANDNHCTMAACHFKRIDNPYFIRYFHVSEIVKKLSY